MLIRNRLDMMSDIARIRPSPIAGTWYPDNPQRLTAAVDAYLAAARLPDLNGEVLAVIAPHAGHRYSGKTAGHAFRAVQGRSFDLVVLVSPMHRYHHGVFLTSAHQAYATPLGEVPVDREAVSQLNAALAESGAGLTPVAYDEEHALEIELPFLQRALAAPFRLLPVMLRTQSTAAAETLGHALSKVLAGRSALLVASTDLSHFYSQVVANQLDRAMLARIESFAPESVLAAEHSGMGYACGAAGVGAVLWAARDLGGDTVVVLDYSTSADETGDPTSVVGYGAAAVLKRA